MQWSGDYHACLFQILIYKPLILEYSNCLKFKLPLFSSPSLQTHEIVAQHSLLGLYIMAIFTELRN